MNILVTAFDPFGGEKVNPALEAVDNWIYYWGTYHYNIRNPNCISQIKRCDST